MAVKVDRGQESVEGYNVFIGGGASAVDEQAMAREYALAVAFDDLPPLLERLLAAYLGHRAEAAETFHEFCRRHDVATLRALAQRAAVRALAA